MSIQKKEVRKIDVSKFSEQEIKDIIKDVMLSKQENSGRNFTIWVDEKGMEEFDKVMREEVSKYGK
jgi:dissimilatory sulfite reductase (desulfoviridin) alpha/beta subunit